MHAAQPLGVDPASARGPLSSHSFATFATSSRPNATLSGDAAGSSSNGSGDGGAVEPPGLSETERRGREEAAASLLSAAEAFGLSSCWQWKPLLDGKQLLPLLGLQRPGPELGRALSAVMDWQLVHPGGSVEECTQFVKEKFPSEKAGRK